MIQRIDQFYLASLSIATKQIHMKDRGCIFQERGQGTPPKMADQLDDMKICVGGSSTLTPRTVV